MRIYFDVSTLDDSLLSKWVTQKIIEESSEYVESFAESLGVPANQIVEPTPYKVSRQAELFAYMTAAMKKTMFSTGKDNSEDAFALKYKMYQTQLDQFEQSLTATTYTTGIASPKRQFPMTVRMYRR